MNNHNSAATIAKQRTKSPYVAPSGLRSVQTISDLAACRIAADEPTDEDVAEIETAKAALRAHVRAREGGPSRQQWIPLRARLRAHLKRRGAIRELAKALCVTTDRIRSWRDAKSFPDGHDLSLLREYLDERAI